MAGHHIGIRSVGLALPPKVRSNDWWPTDVVAKWTAARRPPPPAPANPSPGMIHVLAALAEQAADPFQGTVARHVLSDGVTALDLAEQAGHEALARAGVAPGDVDLLLTHTVMPDVLLGNPATQVHHRLGLPRRCLALETDGAAYAFMLQLSIAEAMIAAGRARLALLVQACGATPYVDMTDPTSVLFGDGATAVVVGPVREGRGLIAAAHHADGRFANTLVAGVPGGTWASEGRGLIHVADPARMREVFLLTADVCKEGIDAVLGDAGLAPRDITMFAMYQGTPWLRRVVQRYAQLEHARSIDSFARTAYLFSAVLPAGLYFAAQEGRIADGDLVLATGGGTGMTFGSIVMRWGA
ncbi:MAG TPA: 3-oxoacyl-[acyl-carrier-protein] synthase III C-terminal domain-containing protein [Kofleriaceae bacterium]|nr:3-oxoacyl-[acyl-carrier-protein] synthase III C-terminal domain-containing protein [Kofleriaceae bacterium]